MLMQPVIAISFQVEDDHPSLSIQKNYIDFIRAHGGAPIMLLPQASDAALVQVLDGIDGVIIPGGDDIDPALYGQRRVSFKDAPKPDRDAFEPRLVRMCAERDIPYLGICRGLQIANVAFGGTLCQDIGAEPGAAQARIDHWQNEPFSAPSHKVSAQPGTLLADILGLTEIAVNSIHHQAIDSVASCLAVNAVSEDGVVEALSRPASSFFLGVQWHPEMNIDAPFSKPLGAAFMAACEDKMRKRARCAVSDRRDMQEEPQNQNGNAELTREYLAYVADDSADAEHRLDAWNYILNSTSVFDGKPVYTAYTPRLFDQATYDQFKRTAETLHGILSKVIVEFQQNPEYRKLFSFDPRLEQLMLVPSGYPSALPFTRVDCFFNEDTKTLKFCEFNTDGSSGMNENREAGNCIKESEPFKRFAAAHKVETCDREMFDEWIDRFLAIYSTYDARVENPRIALVDFLENSALEEFKVYAKLFQARGYQVSIFDVRELEFDGEHLHGKKAIFGESDTDIDLIWRRTVAADVMEHWDESQPLVQAYSAHRVALIGSFATNIVHDKQIFRVLHNPQTTKLLTSEEAALVRECIPQTAFLGPAEIDIDEVKANPSKWVLKPSDGYCSKNVEVGRNHTPEEWARIVDDCLAAEQGASTPFLVQECCDLFKTDTIPMYGNDDDYTAAPKPYNNLTGLYLTDGRFAGVYNRLGPGLIILGSKGGVTSATVWVDVEKR